MAVAPSSGLGGISNMISASETENGGIVRMFPYTFVENEGAALIDRLERSGLDWTEAQRCAFA